MDSPSSTAGAFHGVTETKSAGVERALGSTWTIVSLALQKKKDGVALDFISCITQRNFAFHTDCQLCHAGRGPKGVVLFHMQLFFFFYQRNHPRAEARRSDCGDVTEINRIKKTRDPRQLS